MRTIRALVAAAALALPVVAIAGATSASAVALCKEEGKGPCPKEKTYPAETVITGTLKGTVEFKSAEGEELVSGKCAKSKFEGESTAESGEKTVPGELFSLTFGECTSNLGACAIQVLNQPWHTDIDNMGNYAWTNGGNGAPAIRVTCFFGLSHCRYGANALLGTMAPGNPAVVNVNQTLNLQADPPGGNSFGCGGMFTFVEAFNVLPAPMFIR